MIFLNNLNILKDNETFICLMHGLSPGFNKNTTGATHGARTAYPCGANDFTLGF
jgi:hypothetical protein